MTTKAYLVSWLGKGNIVWTPLELGGSALGFPPGTTTAAVLAAKAAGGMLQKIASGTTLNAIQNVVTLSAGLSAVGAALSLGTLIQAALIYRKLGTIEDRLKQVQGKFELHFLDRSLDHFEAVHGSFAGLVPASAAALDEDLESALKALVDTKELRVPGYMKLRLYAASTATEQWNRMLYTIIHDGALPEVSDERLQKWVAETDIPDQLGLPRGGYTSQARILSEWGTLISSEGPKSKSLLEHLLGADDADQPPMSQAMSRKHFDRTRPVVEMLRELRVAGEQAAALEDKLLASDQKCLLLMEPQ